MRLFSFSAALLLCSTLAFSQTINTSGQNWNLLGATEDITDLSVFTDECVNKVWAYGDNWESYSPGTNSDLASISQGKGFWLKSKGSCEISAGTSGGESTTTSISTSGQNWYLLGATENISDLSIFTDECVQGIWAYDGSGWGAYTPGGSSGLTSIAQGKGFWLKSKSTCTITNSSSENISGAWTLLDDFSGSELDETIWGTQQMGDSSFEVVDGSLKVNVAKPTDGNSQSGARVVHEISSDVNGIEVNITPETDTGTTENIYFRSGLTFQSISQENTAAHLNTAFRLTNGSMYAVIWAMNEDQSEYLINTGTTLLDSVQKGEPYTLRIELVDGAPVVSVVDSSENTYCYSFKYEIADQYQATGISMMMVQVDHYAESSQSKTSVLLDNAKILEGASATTCTNALYKDISSTLSGTITNYGDYDSSEVEYIRFMRTDMIDPENWNAVICKVQSDNSFGDECLVHGDITNFVAGKEYQIVLANGLTNGYVAESNGIGNSVNKTLSSLTGISADFSQ